MKFIMRYPDGHSY